MYVWASAARAYSVLGNVRLLAKVCSRLQSPPPLSSLNTDMVSYIICFASSFPACTEQFVVTVNFQMAASEIIRGDKKKK